MTNSNRFVALKRWGLDACGNLFHSGRPGFAVYCLALLFVPIPCSAQTTVTATPNTLSFAYTIGGPAPALQSVLLSTMNPATGIAVVQESYTGSCFPPGSPYGWVNEPYGVSNFYAPYSILFGVSTTGFTAGTAGSYTCTLMFGGGGMVGEENVGNASVSITLVVSNAAAPTPTVTGVECNPASLSSGQSSSCSVTLSAAAPSGGATVSLSWGTIGSSASSSWLTVPASVTVSGGSTSASFTATAGTISGAISATITAGYNSSSQTATIQLSAPLPTIAALSCVSLTLSPGQSSLCTVSLSAASPSGGATVSLSSSNTSLTVVGSVTVSAGSTTASFPVTAGTISVASYATITASYNGSSQMSTIQLTAPPTISSLSPTTMMAGQPAFTLTVGGNGFAPGAAVYWNGSLLQTMFTSPTQLTALVPANLIRAGGTAAVTVESSGATSNSLDVYIYPTVSSLSPASANAGGAAFTLKVNGTGFTSGTVAYWNGSQLQITSVSPTQITAFVPAGLITAPGTFPVMVVANSLGSSSIGFTVNPTSQSAPATISSLSPSTVYVGQPSFTLTVNGSGFTPGAAVQMNGSQLPTTFVNSTQLTATVPASFIMASGTATITVISGGVPSAGASFVINGIGVHAAFAIVVRPTSTGTVQEGTMVSTQVPIVSAGGGSPTVQGTSSCGSLTVEGTGCPWLVVGPRVMVPPGQLSVTVDTSSLPPGSYAATLTIQCDGTPPCLPVTTTYQVTVVAPSSGTALSADLFPNSTTAGGPALTLSVPGSGFESESTVYWAGSPLATAYMSPTQLTASVPANLIASPGTVNVTVANPDGASSAPVGFSILPIPDSTISLNSNSMIEGGNAFTLTVTGSGFMSSSKVEWNGTPLSTNYVSPNRLTASVPASLIASPGTATITVDNPGGMNSLPATFNVSVAPLPVSITSLSPASPVVSASAQTVVVTGTNFESGLAAALAAPSGATTNFSGSQIQNLSATSFQISPVLASVGTYSLQVKNPDGGMSTSFPFTVATTPRVNVTKVGNGASFAQSFAPGMLMTVFGTGLSSGAPETVTSAPLPLTSESGTSVTINGMSAPLLYISAVQINFQLPYEAAVGDATLTVNSGGQSGSINFTVAPAGPGIFIDSTNNHIVPNESAAAGSTIGFFLTGAGEVTPPEATGHTPEQGTTPIPNLALTMTVGGIPVTPVYVGIPVWSVGVLQINFPVPSNLTGTQQVIVTIGGVSSPPALLDVTP
jgi:uncharacterized protein (TIGR03437 family)